MMRIKTLFLFLTLFSLSLSNIQADTCYVDEPGCNANICCAPCGPNQGLWVSGSAFHFNETKTFGSQKGDANNTLFGYERFISLNTILGGYMSREHSYAKSNKVELARDFAEINGWGGGFYLLQYLPCYWSANFNFGYVTLCEEINNRSDLGDDSYSDIDGDRWQVALGLTWAPPAWNNIYFAGSINYLYASLHLDSYTDKYDRTASEQDANVGMGEVIGKFYSCFNECIYPYVRIGLGYDLHRDINYPKTTALVFTPFPSLRQRFEWNVGAGLQLINFCKTGSVSIGYLHRQRADQIKIEEVNVFAMIRF